MIIDRGASVRRASASHKLHLFHVGRDSALADKQPRPRSVPTAIGTENKTWRSASAHKS